MRDLTKFQKKCERKLTEALSTHRKKLEGRSLDGQKETYIHAHISDSDIEVWIYDDEAMITGQGVDLRFESPDFDTDDELIETFIHNVITEITA